MIVFRRVRLFGAGVAVAGALLVAAACSSTDRSETPITPPIFTEPDAEASVPPPPACGLHCSPDLHTVLTGCPGAETIVSTCSADQGCGQGQCVSACQAAQFSKGSTGCDFWTLPPDDQGEGPGSCFAALVANTWNRPVTLTAGYGANSIDISQATYTVARTGANDAVYTLLSGPLPVGEVAVVFLAQAANVIDVFNATPCPVNTKVALSADPIRHGTTRTTAFNIQADAPVSGYSIYPYGGAATHFPSATLLLPVSSWGSDYVAISAHDFGGGLESGRTLQIVANQDNTVVSIQPNVEIASGNGVAGTPAGVTQSWTIGKGDVLQFDQIEMTGSPISTSKPVALFGGSQCTYVPAEYGTCDMLQQQITPTSLWGTEYALAPFPPRVSSFSGDAAREQVPYTLVGGADGTTLTYEPARPLGAPDTLDFGANATFITDQLLVVKSQDSKHPFYASVYMTGSQFGGGAPPNLVSGDPDYVNIPPTDQFLDHYVFFTDYTYPETRLTIVRRKTPDGFLPVELDCAGEVTGFQPLGTSGELELAWVSLTSGYLPQTFTKGQCGYGRQEASSQGTFAITVWGWAQDSSYGYVGGTGLRPINDAPQHPVH